MASMAALVLKGQRSRRFYGLGLKMEEISKGIFPDLQVGRRMETSGKDEQDKKQTSPEDLIEQF